MAPPLRVEEVHWELTNHCNFSCVHCYLSHDSRPELDTKQVLRILDELHECGVLYLTLSGGEPLLRRDFAEIYGHAHRLGFLINVFTNGSRISGEVLELFSKFPPQKVEITLNGIREATFESVTAKPGSFSATMEGIRRLNEAGICLGLKTNGMTLNREEVHAIRAFARALPNVFFKFDTAIMPRRDHDRSPAQYRLSAREIFDIYEADPEMRAAIEAECASSVEIPNDKPLFLCEAGTTRFHISAWGDLHPCHTVRPLRVSLLHSHFRDAAAELHHRVRSFHYPAASPCGTCSAIGNCNSCPGLAELEGRDPFRPAEYHCGVAKQTVARFAPGPRGAL